MERNDPMTYLTKMTAVEYSENADCPRWLAFLDDIFRGIKTLSDTFRKLWDIP